MNARLRDLGISQLAASQMGKLSRSTLIKLGKDGKVPTDRTLTKLDELLSWEPGSARATMFGSEPGRREVPDRILGPADRTANDDYLNLAAQIEQRLLELNMTKSRLVAVGGPPRSTLAALGKRGFQPSLDTLARLDTHLLWEPGSAAVTLKGGLPIRRGVTPIPHRSLVPLSAALDRLRRLAAQLSRYQDGISQMQTEVTEAINHVTLAISDLGDVRRRDVFTAKDSGTDDEGNGAWWA